MGLDIAIYSREKEFLNSFRAGGYSFFGKFRNWICGIILNIKDKKIQELFLDFSFHSDCLGKMNFTKCKQLLKGFESKEFKEQLFFEFLDDKNKYYKYFLEVLEEWKKGLKLAVKNKGFLIFC